MGACKPPGPAIGVDLGVKALAVCSMPVPGLTDGDGVVTNPKHLNRYARRMARLRSQCLRRRGPSKSGPGPSKRWQHSKARLARCHAQVAMARGDGLHKLTTALAKTHGMVVVRT